MTINVLKLGGGAGVDQAAVLQNLAARIQSGERWVLVHGASDAANRLAEQVGYPAQTLVTAGGHTSRYTDARTIEIFSAGCPAREEAVGLVTQVACPSCEVTVLDRQDPSVASQAKRLGIRSVPAG